MDYWMKTKVSMNEQDKQYLSLNLECNGSLKARETARIGRTNSKYTIRNSCNTRNKMEWKWTNRKKQLFITLQCI